MKLTVVIPTHNRAFFIEKSLENLYKINDCEIIIIENNSDEKNLEKYKELEISQNVKVFYVKKEGFFAGDARNLGIEKASGEYVFFFDDDDEVTNDFVTFVNTTIFTENVYRFPYWFNGQLRKPSLTKSVSKTSVFDTVQPSTFLCKREYLLMHQIKFASKVVHQDTHFAEMIYSSKVKQNVLKVPSIIYNTSNESIQRSNKKIETELKSIREFYDPKYKHGEMFAFKLIVNADHYLNKYKYDIPANEVKKALKAEFNKLNKMKLLKDLPMTYKFIFLKWIFKKTN